MSLPLIEMTAEKAGQLRKPFAAGQVGKLPRVTCGACREANKNRRPTCDNHSRSRCETCGNYMTVAHMHLDYVGHAELTDRLLAVDPYWGWEPFAIGEDGLPRLDRDGGLWIRLTICGVTRIGYGDAGSKQGGDAMKERIGDALRNAGMRFGLALDLWSKGEKDENGRMMSDDAPSQQDQRPAQGQQPNGWGAAERTGADGQGGAQQGSRPEVGQGGASPAASSQSIPARATAAVDYLIGAQNEQQAKTRQGWAQGQGAVARTDVSGVVPADVRDKLGHQQGANLSVAQLAEKVSDYLAAGYAPLRAPKTAPATPTGDTTAPPEGHPADTDTGEQKPHPSEDASEASGHPADEKESA